jgi:hypothetical protein
MTPRNKIGTLLVLISLGLLGPGLFLPMLHLKVSGSVQAKFAQLEGTMIDTTRSVLGTIKDLWDQDRILVAVLIFAFSALVPLFKGITILCALFIKSPRRQKLYQVVNNISKWSMADVFVVAILLAYLSTAGHVEKIVESVTIFGMKIPVELGFLMDSQILVGYYYFLAYCLVSMIALHVVKIPDDPKHT